MHISAGSFTTGSPTSEVGRQDNEEPQRLVTVPAFWMGQYAVTQAQYQAVMGENPSHFRDPNRPVEPVSWHQAAKFCQKLSKRTGLNYRLPSEAEWQYACRAGTIVDPFHFGPTLTTELANYNGQYAYGSGPCGEFRQETIKVGQFPPNSFCLYDMHGNIREWCADPWHDTHQSNPIDKQDWAQSDEADRYVLRGGSWSYVPELCRSAYRDWGRPSLTPNDVGFRVVCDGEG